MRTCVLINAERSSLELAPNPRLKGANRMPSVETENLSESQEFDEIDPPLPHLVLRDERLGTAKPPCDFSLGQPRAGPRLGEHLPETLVVFREPTPRHVLLSQSSRKLEAKSGYPKLE